MTNFNKKDLLLLEAQRTLTNVMLSRLALKNENKLIFKSALELLVPSKTALKYSLSMHDLIKIMPTKMKQTLSALYEKLKNNKNCRKPNYFNQQLITDLSKLFSKKVTEKNVDIIASVIFYFTKRQNTLTRKIFESELECIDTNDINSIIHVINFEETITQFENIVLVFANNNNTMSPMSENAPVLEIPRSNDTTPLNLVHKNLLLNTGTSKQPIVLLTTGSYNPVHKMHIHAFGLTKEFLEREHNMVVVGAFISPSNDSYVKNKLNTDAIPSVHRLAMCKSAIKDAGYSKWLAVDSWECKNSMFIDFPHSVKTMTDYIGGIRTGSKQRVKLWYVCGSDIFLSSGPLMSMRQKGNGIVVMTRGSDGIVSNWKKNLIVLKSNDLGTNDMSSTKIRELMANGLDYSHLTFSSVRKYLQKHNL